MGEQKKAMASGRGKRKASFQRWAAKFPGRRIKRIERHILAHPDDHAAVGALARIEVSAYTYKSKVEMVLPKGKKP